MKLKDVEVGEEYILYESYNCKTPFKVLSKEHVEATENVAAGTSVKAMTLDGEVEYFEADEYYAWPLHVERIR